MRCTWSEPWSWGEIEVFAEKGRKRKITHCEILTHRLELVNGVGVIMILLPFPLEQLQCLLQYRQRSDVSWGRFLLSAVLFRQESTPAYRSETQVFLLELLVCPLDRESIPIYNILPSVSSSDAIRLCVETERKKRLQDPPP